MLDDVAKVPHDGVPVVLRWLPVAGREPDETDPRQRCIGFVMERCLADPRGEQLEVPLGGEPEFVSINALAA